MKKQARPPRTEFSYPFAYNITGTGVGYLVGTPPCLVVHGLICKRPGRHMWGVGGSRVIKHRQRGPWIITVLNTGLSVDSSLFRFVYLDDALALANFIIDAAPMLDIPLYSTNASAVQESVRVDNALMVAIKDFVLKLDPLMAPLESSFRSNQEWRTELRDKLRRKLV